MDRAPSLAEALFGRGRPEPPAEVWQDREVRFDAPAAELACRRGEEVLDYMGCVEDTKGNNGEAGELLVTNLRVMWSRRGLKRTNISIGLDCITHIAAKPAASRLKGNATALYLLTRAGTARYEFIFTALTPGDGGPELLAIVQGVSQAYEGSRLYRELKLRGAIIADNNLRLLPGEQAYSKVSGVVNLSSDAGAAGLFFVTGLRLVWFSAASDSFSVSIPYLQVKCVRVADSKVGPCLVVETAQRAGGYVLGFKVEPRETLDYVFKEVHSLWQAYSACPVIGVQYDRDGVRRDAAVAAVAQGAAGAALAQAQAAGAGAEDAHILEDSASCRPDAWAAAAYGPAAAAGGRADDEGPRGPVFCAELGLAIEAPRDPAVTVRQLWCVL